MSGEDVLSDRPLVRCSSSSLFYVLKDGRGNWGGMKRVSLEKVYWIRPLYITQKIHSFTFVCLGKNLSSSLQTEGESMVKGIYADESSVAEICTEVMVVEACGGESQIAV